MEAYIVMIGTTVALKQFAICKDVGEIRPFLNESLLVEELDNDSESWKFQQGFTNSILYELIAVGDNIISGDNGNWKIVIKKLSEALDENPIFNPEDLF